MIAAVSQVHPRSDQTLLERTAEVGALEAAVTSAAAGTGSAVIVEGEAGIGKTALLTTAGETAAAGSLTVLRARGGELERDLTFGVVRQLFEGLLARTPRKRRDALLDAAARPAAGLFGHGAPDGLPDEPSLVHAVYWLCANLAEHGPVCLVVDDAQWSDAASLRWLVYLARRLEELPVALLVAVRSGEPGAPVELLEALATQPAVWRVRPRMLSGCASAELVRDAYGEGADAGFCRAVHEAAGGNPFLVREVLASLLADGVPPDAEHAEGVARLQPQAVASSVLLRLGRLPADAVALARAVAVLGTETPLARAAALAGLAAEAAASAADALAAAHVLRPGLPLDFLHPVIRSVLYQDVPAGERSRAHARAAQVLQAEGAPAMDSVVHLLATEPAGDPAVVACLRAAVAAEPDARRAVVLLRRALAEPPPAERRAELLLELGEIEARAYQPEAIGHLTEARALAAGGDLEPRAVQALARAWTLDPRPGAALEWAEAELELQPGDDLALALHALEVIRGHVTPGQAAKLRAGAAGAGTPAARYLLAALAYKALDHGTAADAEALAEAALQGGLEAEGVRGSGFILALAGLETADALDRAAGLARSATSEARRRGDLSGFALALTLRADVEARAGDLAEAASHATDALRLASEHGLAWAEPVAIATLLEVLAGQGRLEEADRLLEERELSEWQRGSARAAVHLHARGRLRLAQGRPDEALADFEGVGEIVRRYAVDHPASLPWRSDAALALLGLDRRDEAAALVAEELDLARGFGARHPIGAALRVAGLVEGGEAGRALLAEAVDVLAESPARLARAHALVDLGAALRRANERLAARDRLRAGLDLAHRCGATALEERAVQEIEASGARPRRRVISGVDALTPSERRVARMAARGMANRDIAQALFLSVRTIENQLRQVYLKLDVAGRRELPEALGMDSEP
jgi:DNA-binding CsgD family transcriptional regulator